MKKNVWIAFICLLLTVSLCAACGGSGGEGKATPLDGTYRNRMEGPDGYITETMSLNQGAYYLRISEGGEVEDLSRGTYTVSGNTVKFAPASGHSLQKFTGTVSAGNLIFEYGRAYVLPKV